MAKGPQSIAFGRWALVLAVKLVSHECALPWGQDRPVTSPEPTNTTTATITITIKQSDTRAPWFLPCTQLHNDTSVCISSPYSGRVNISEMSVSRRAQTVPLGCSHWEALNHFHELVLVSSIMQMIQQNREPLSSPTPSSTVCLCSYSRGEARAGPPAQGCLTFTLSQTPPSNKSHSVHAEPWDLPWAGRAPVADLVLVVCDCLPCCCRQTLSSWSQDPSMLSTLTTPSVTGSCTGLLGVSRPCHLPQGTLLMSPVVPAKREGLGFAPLFLPHKYN